MTESVHENFMKEALKQANLALEKGEVPVGAVVVYKNRVIARAHNQTEMLRDPTAHAEIIEHLVPSHPPSLGAYDSTDHLG